MGSGQSKVIDSEHTQKFVEQATNLQKTFQRLQGRLSAAEKEQDSLRQQKTSLEGQMQKRANELIIQRQQLQKKLSQMNVNESAERQKTQAQILNIQKRLEVATKSTSSISQNVNKFRTSFITRTPVQNASSGSVSMTPTVTAG